MLPAFLGIKLLKPKSWAAEKFVNSSTIVPAQQIAKMETFVGNKHILGFFLCLWRVGMKFLAEEKKQFIKIKLRSFKIRSLKWWLRGN